MPALTKQPKNPNFLSQLGYKLVLKRAPHLSYFAAESELPGLTLEVADQPNPFITIPWPGHKMKFDYWDYTFHVDENMENYLEMFDWMVALGFPDDMTGYPKLTSGEGVVSDGTLIINSSAKNPNMTIRFRDMFPQRLSALRLAVTDDDVKYVECTVTFAYQRFYIDRLGKN